MEKAENPREPRHGEREDDYISYCIKYFIDKGEYQNTKNGRKKASAHCYSLYRRYGGENKMEKITLCAELPVSNLIESKDGDTMALPDGVTMIIGDNTYNGRYFPIEELRKSINKWNGLPIVLNHDETVENVVGHLEDITLTADGKLRAKPVIDNYEKSPTAKSYILEQKRIGNVANVSISAWYDPSWETINEVENTLVTRNLKPAHLGIVVHGACSPDQGCGIGLKKAGDDNVVNPKDDSERIAMLEEVKKLEKEVETNG